MDVMLRSLGRLVATYWICVRLKSSVRFESSAGFA
jgi:hypothetical protein